MNARADLPALPIDEAGGAQRPWASRVLGAARQPFSDFGFSRLNADGTRQHYRVSGEPIFNQAKGCTGYRGIGAQITLAGPPELAAAHTAQ